MSIEQTNVIDFLVNDRRKRRAVLMVSDHLDWDHDEARHLSLLQDKFNHYIYFIESGKMVETEPDLEGLPVTIIVWGKYPLSERALEFYKLARERSIELGFSLEFDLGGKSFEKR